MAFKLGRMVLDSPETWNEQVGDPVTNIGGAPVPAVRSALRHSVDVPTFSSPIGEDTVERRMRLRRQIRALLNNTAYKMLGVFLIWDEDTEQNGWYIPDQGQLVAGADSPLTHGYFKLENFVWFKVGALRTHRAAIGLSLKDIRTGLYVRDVLRRVYSTDFSGLPALYLTYLHAGISDVLNTTSLQTIPTIPLPAGRDGGASQFALAQTDLEVISYEQPEAERNFGDVVIYDQRGLAGLPIGAEDPQEFGWEEVYGPDYPLTEEAAPVLDNGLVRVVYDPTGHGFKVYLWTGAEYAQQGEMKFVFRSASTEALMHTLASSAVKEYTPERGVIQAVFTVEVFGEKLRVTVFITLQRGWRGPRFEMYPSPISSGEALIQTDATLNWSLPTQPANTSVVKIDASGAAAIVATAGSGTVDYPEGAIGDATFSGENEVMQITQGGGYQVSLAVVRSAIAARTVAGITNIVALRSEGEAGYISAHMMFTKAQIHQELYEGGGWTGGTGTTAVLDTGASGVFGLSSKAERTSDANPHVTSANWPNNYYATYRVMARLRITSGTLHIYAKTGATTGATKTTTSATYVWLDLGEIIANNTTLEIHAWLTGGSGSPALFVDRIAAFQTEDRMTANGGTYAGGRDLGQAVLIDSRATPTVITRA